MPNSKTQPERVLSLDDFWPYQVTVLSDRIARRTSKIVKEHGLNLSQWRVLAAIAEVPGRTSVEVVTVTPMDKGIVSRATKALLAMGLVRREASQSDGRISHLHLTDAGVTLYHQLIPCVAAILERANIGLSSEAQRRLSEQLGELMRVIPDLR
ncbi:MAG: MarR family winged helix-turn-helix transcriptional regulator [Myxococcota bacterium]